MNSAYQIIDDKVVVTSDLGLKTNREITNNIEDILITENNIEEIRELIIKEKNNISRGNPTEAIGPAYIGLTLSNLILAISRFISANVIGVIIHICASAAFFTTAYISSILPKIRRKKIKDKKIEVLTQKLEEEKEKLSELKEDNTNDLMCVNQDFKMLSRSIKMKMLKDRLTDINLYMNHRRKIIRLYKNGLLEGELFENCASRDTINFIIELAKNDSRIEKKKEKKKVKQYANDIEY